MLKIDRELERPDARLVYGDSGGTGPAVVLLHGAGLDHAMFQEAATALAAAGRRVILGDLRGHGASTMTSATRFTATDALHDLAALLEATDAARPVLVGHSLGGNLAQAFVRAHPGRASGLVVVDSTWNSGPLSGLERLGLRLAAPTLAAIPARTLPGLMARASAVTPSAVERAEQTFARMPKRVFVDVWRATVSFVDPRPGFRSPVPLALVRGAEDRTGNIATAMPRWARTEGITERIVPDAGHILTWDAPEESSRALVAAVEEVARR